MHQKVVHVLSLLTQATLFTGRTYWVYWISVRKFICPTDTCVWDKNMSNTYSRYPQVPKSSKGVLIITNENYFLAFSVEKYTHSLVCLNYEQLVEVPRSICDLQYFLLLKNRPNHDAIGQVCFREQNSLMAIQTTNVYLLQCAATNPHSQDLRFL